MTCVFIIQENVWYNIWYLVNIVIYHLINDIHYRVLPTHILKISNIKTSNSIHIKPDYLNKKKKELVQTLYLRVMGYQCHSPCLRHSFLKPRDPVKFKIPTREKMQIIQFSPKQKSMRSLSYPSNLREWAPNKDANFHLTYAFNKLQISKLSIPIP